MGDRENLMPRITDFRYRVDWVGPAIAKISTGTWLEQGVSSVAGEEGVRWGGAMPTARGFPDCLGWRRPWAARFRTLSWSMAFGAVVNKGNAAQPIDKVRKMGFPG